MLMAKMKSKKVKISNDQSVAVQSSIVWIIIGLMMALGGFVWATYTDSNPEVIGANVGSSLLSTVGLIIVVAALLIMAGTIITTQVKTRKRRK